MKAVSSMRPTKIRELAEQSLREGRLEGIIDAPNSGRWGDWVYYVRGGEQCCRRYLMPRDPRTPAQLRSRAASLTKVLLSMLGHEAAFLSAEYLQREGTGAWVSWSVQPREQGQNGPAVEVGISPSLGSFRSVLARCAQSGSFSYKSLHSLASVCRF